MKKFKILGIVSAIILAIDFILLYPISKFIFTSDVLLKMEAFYRHFINPIALVGFNFALYIVLKQTKIKKVFIPILVITILQVVISIISFIPSDHSSSNLIMFCHGYIILGSNITFAVWAIIYLLFKDRIKKTNRFVILMLISNFMIFVSGSFGATVITIRDENFLPITIATSLTLLLYGVSYLLGLSFFTAPSPLSQAEKESSI